MTPSPDRRDPPRKKILLAAEEPRSRQYVQSSLEHVGHTVVAITELAGALEMAKAEPMDLIIVDLYASTQQLDLGCEMVRAIRADPSLAHLPVILLHPPSADSRYHPRNWGPLPPDACTYMRKPPKRVELWALVDDPRPGDSWDHPRSPFVYRPGEWPEIEQSQRRPRWRWWSR